MSQPSQETLGMLRKELSLKDHIDAPILKTIGLMNLWGLRTTWACAGMHYDKPAVTKDHAPFLQIFIHADGPSFEKMVRLIDCQEFGWGANAIFMRLVKQMNQDPMIVMTGPPPSNGEMWQGENSPHRHEFTNMLISLLNTRLLCFKNEFRDSAILTDQNAVMKSVMPYWAYVPVKDWTFTKKEILEMA